MSATDARVPKHIAVIMDGNGRWARKRALPRHAGHRAGVKSVREIVEVSASRGVSCLTLFAFSTENWKRPEEEVSSLMGLFFDALRREVEELHRNNVKLQIIGNRDKLNLKLLERIEKAEELTAGNTGLHLLIAVAYGGHWDIAEAARRACEQVKAGTLQPDQVDEAFLHQQMQLAGLPDPDLLIRTGGEQRISNFLLWNIAYAEMYFTETLWPDFREKHLDEAIAFFATKQRRYGNTPEQLGAVKC